MDIVLPWLLLPDRRSLLLAQLAQRLRRAREIRRLDPWDLLIAGHVGDQLDREVTAAGGQLELQRQRGRVESAVCAVFGVCVVGRGFGRGRHGDGSEVFDSGLSYADVVFWDCECGCEWVGYD